MNPRLHDIAPEDLADVRSLKEIKVQFISLVDDPAHGRELILKSVAPDGMAVVRKRVAIRKQDAARRRVYGIVLAPGEVDGEGDTVTVEAIEKAAYRFMRHGRLTNVDEQHDEVPGKGYVVESWLVRGGDPLFPDEPEGAWAAGVTVTDDRVWTKIQNGEITGFSVDAYAKRVPVEKAMTGLGRAIRTARERAEMSRVELERAMSGSGARDASTIGQIERGEIEDVPDEVLREFAATLPGVSLTQLRRLRDRVTKSDEDDMDKEGLLDQIKALLGGERTTKAASDPFDTEVQEIKREMAAAMAAAGIREMAGEDLDALAEAVGVEQQLDVEAVEREMAAGGSSVDIQEIKREMAATMTPPKIIIKPGRMEEAPDDGVPVLRIEPAALQKRAADAAPGSGPGRDSGSSAGQDAGAGAEQEAEVLAEEILKAVQDVADAQAATVEDLTTRLSRIEKQTTGRRSILGGLDEQPDDGDKGYKGVKIL